MSIEPQQTPEPPEHPTAQILRFERKKNAAPKLTSPLEGLGKYSQGKQPDDYAHRQKANAAALVVILLLVIGGVWLAVKMSDLRKAQDCVMSGRRDCGTKQLSGVNIR